VTRIKNVKRFITSMLLIVTS